ncbi:Cytoplasmic glyoxalase II [Steccherinum ochraceum]|uniref:Cytoplasmic glyoxalase II n=1 Tax=Steccherinum ochraceum TaxID=92696 RepID=A0A4R0RER7_9APHY|nr:Cytoplasmic glyoxalase II [Steccherinum ochraceum]
MVKVVPIPVNGSHANYAYLIIDNKKAAVVDPYDVPKVLKEAENQGVSEIIACLTTHHHDDHAGGNQDLADKLPNVPIYGGSKQGLAVNHIVKDKDEIKLTDNIHIKYDTRSRISHFPN